VVTNTGRKPHPKSRTMINPQERLILTFSGGAGYGDPAQRDRDAIRSDIRNGYITVEAARRDYGIDV
jgi:N-methylhydantoinase B